MVNRQTLTDEELETVMIKVEWIMNSRPLTTTSGEDTSVVAITPNHLMGIRTVETETVRVDLAAKTQVARSKTGSCGE